MRSRSVSLLFRAWAALAACTLPVGCCSRCGIWHVDRCASIEPGAIPQPVGTYACQWQRAHIDQANKDDFVFYENEWFLGGRELGPAGRQHLQELASRFGDSQTRIVLEPAMDPEHNRTLAELNEARRQTLARELATLGVEGAESWIVVGPPEALPLEGPDAVRIGTNRLRGNQGGGGGRGGGGGFGGGGGGGGFGGGGGGFGGGGYF